MPIQNDFQIQCQRGEKQGSEACGVCYYLCGKVYALKMSRKIHKKLLTAVSSLIRKLEVWSRRITFHFIPTNACFFNKLMQYNFNYLILRSKSPVQNHHDEISRISQKTMQSLCVRFKIHIFNLAILSSSNKHRKSLRWALNSGLFD